MDWFNYYGLGIMALIMVPNIIYAVKHKDGAENKYANKAVEILEQTGRSEEHTSELQSPA